MINSKRFFFTLHSFWSESSKGKKVCFFEALWTRFHALYLDQICLQFYRVSKFKVILKLIQKVNLHIYKWMLLFIIIWNDFLNGKIFSLSTLLLWISLCACMTQPKNFCFSIFFCSKRYIFYYYFGFAFNCLNVRSIFKSFFCIKT